MSDNRTVIAVTVISRTVEPGKPGDRLKGIRPTPPKIQMIQPKTVFQTQSKEEFDDLMAMGAIRLPDKGEEVTVDPSAALPKAKKPAAPKAPAAGKDDGKPSTGKDDGKSSTGKSSTGKDADDGDSLV